MQDIERRLRAIEEQHGPWTAMAIQLADGTYTRAAAPDYRLKRILQVCSDLVRKPLNECRVLDLACLEGHYAIEFAMHGAEVVGIEGRAASVAKCDFARDALGLDRLAFHQDDVRNLSVEKYGRFDIVICSGLLYHLPAKEADHLLRAMYDTCTGIVLIDTFIALSSQLSVEIAGATRHGHVYREHDPTETKEQRAKKLWASLDNESSFWFTQASLTNMLVDIGFTSLVDVLVPTAPAMPRDRKTYVAIKGAPCRVLSSEVSNGAAAQRVPEGENPNVDASQTPPSAVFATAKRLLPQPVKNAIKPALRALKILPPDTTPAFLRAKKGD
jgi:2-polyprenyl-3-methyl-5-hydroxy-6-metoxy-1,4-benzoquinol methylase